MSQIPDVKLVVKIENRQPVELMDLTKSLLAMASQFNSYVSKHGDLKESREAKLYVKEIKTGSIVLELIEIATVGIIPFIENVNTIAGFGEYCKSAFDFFLKGEKKEDYGDMTVTDYREMSQIVNPVAKDNGSQLNLSTVINGDVTFNFNISSTEANAIQNIAKNRIEQLSVPEQSNDVNKKVLMYWYQARGDVKSKTGNKGVIEELSANPANIIFDDDQIKEAMIRDQENPFLKAYVVDAKVQTVKGKVVAYKIIRLHESFDRNDN